MTSNARIIVRLEGGLGNQLFQFSAAYVLAHQIRGVLTVDATRVRLQHDGRGITAFNLPYPMRTTARWVPARPAGFAHRYQKAERGLSRLATRSWSVLRDREGLDGALAISPKDYVLEGYFQDPDIAELATSLGAFAFLELKEPSSWFEKTSTELQDARPAGIHIRRGDYRMHRGWGLLGSAYYSEALRTLGAGPDREVWAFSDEPEAARGILEKLEFPNHRILSPPPTSPAGESMMLMSMCDLLVVGNSTMSWWAGQLSNRRCAFPESMHPDDRNPLPLRNAVSIPSVWSADD